MSELKNDRLLRALLRQPVNQTPIWIMRQAGRYLPEYRATRAKAGSFMDLCKNPELACEVTMQPLRRFELDAAILFSDILTIPDAMGLGLYFAEGEGPKFNNPIDSKRTVEKLFVPDPETELTYVMDAVRTIRKELNAKVPLIGFAGSPWTLATYMVEGGSSKTFSKIKGLLYSDPSLLHQILAITAKAVGQYLNAQIQAGAQALMIFDTWGGTLSYYAYPEFSLDYMQQIKQELIREHEGITVPVVIFTKGGVGWLKQQSNIGADALGLDWSVDINAARALVGDKVALQGNMDPCVLHGTVESVKQEVRKILDGFGAGSGHVFNLGHGIHPDMDPDKVKVLVDYVHEYSMNFHQD